jgi:peptidoglycan/LPS O-acetylase OafA/YrhL
MFAGNILFWFERGALSLRQLIICGVIAVTALTISLEAGYGHDWGLGESPGRFVTSYAVAAIAFGLAWRFWKSVSAPLLWLGGVSYSVYLLHSITLDVVDAGFAGPASWWKLGLAASACLLLAHASYRFVEKPGIALGKRIRDLGLARPIREPVAG